jgi:pimeloyl-ACP methyl ester carboxylesterase
MNIVRKHGYGQEYFMRPVTLLVNVLFLLLVGLAGCGDSENTGLAISSDQSTIAYSVEGEGEVALVFVHGWCCDQTYWRFQIEEFAKDYKVVTVDLAGHGLSSSARKDYTMPLFGADVAAVVKKLDLEKVVLVSHSMGGAVMIQAAELLGDRVVGMVGVDTLQKVSFGMEEAAVTPFIAAMSRDFPTATSRFSRGMFLASADSNLVNEIAVDMASAPPAVALSAMREYLLFDNKPTLDKLEVPLHCIESVVIPIDMDGWIFYKGGVSFDTMPKVGHFIQLVAPDRFNPLLRTTVEKFTALSPAH